MSGWKWLAVAVLVLVGVVVGGFSMPEDAVKRAAALTPIATVLLAFLGFLFTATKARAEWNDWKDRQVTTKRAEVAAEVLTAVIDSVDALKQLCSAVQIDDRGDGAETLAQKFARRWHRHFETFDRLATARVRAQVFLDDETSEILRKLHDLKASAWANQCTWVQFTDDARLYNEAFEAPKARLDDVLNAALAHIRPLAQLSQPHAESRAIAKK